jgi:hypothetical protein
MISKVETIPVTGIGGLLDWKIGRIPHCLDYSLTDSCEAVSLSRRLRSTPKTYFMVLFLLEAESTPGP